MTAPQMTATSTRADAKKAKSQNGSPQNLVFLFSFHDFSFQDFSFQVFSSHAVPPKETGWEESGAGWTASGSDSDSLAWTVGVGGACGIGMFAGVMLGSSAALPSSTGARGEAELATVFCTP